MFDLSHRTFHISRLTWFCCLFIVYSACGTRPLITPISGTVAPNFTLKDQYDTEYRLDGFRGESVLLLGCDKEGVDGSGNWFHLFNEQYADRLRILPIFNASSLPFFARLFMKGRIKAEFRSSAEESNLPNILMDWDGKVSRQYGIPSEKCAVVLINRLGRIQVFIPLGQMDEQKIQETFNLIDQQMTQ